MASRLNWAMRRGEEWGEKEEDKKGPRKKGQENAKMGRAKKAQG